MQLVTASLGGLLQIYQPTSQVGEGAVRLPILPILLLPPPLSLEVRLVLRISSWSSSCPSLCCRCFTATSAVHPLPPPPGGGWSLRGPPGGQTAGSAAPQAPGCLPGGHQQETVTTDPLLPPSSVGGRGAQARVIATCSVWLTSTRWPGAAQTDRHTLYSLQFTPILLCTPVEARRAEALPR